MEMVQVAILVAIAVAIGLIFKSEITDFVNDTFGSLSKKQILKSCRSIKEAASI